MSDFNDRILALSENKKQLLAGLLAAMPVSADADGVSRDRLIAYFTAGEQVSEDRLKEHISNRVPSYMIPDRFVQVEEIPKLPNGKIDFGKLAPPEQEAKQEVKPSGETEQILIDIWQDVLNFEPVNVRDNFFEIGGDSILSIQIVAKAARKGLILEPNDLFEHQTVEELAAVVRHENQAVNLTPYSGTVPLLPIQHWFLEEHRAAPQFWNQGIRINLRSPLPVKSVEESVSKLVSRHDSLRMKFTNSAGLWTSSIGNGSGETHYFKHVSDEAEADAALLDVQTGFDLENGPLVAAVGVGREDEVSSLFLIAHHLVIDQFSWRLILDDLQKLISKNTDLESASSYGRWANQIGDQINRAPFAEELEYWRGQSPDGLPNELLDKAPFREDSIESVAHSLGADQSALFDSRTKDRKGEGLLITAAAEAITRTAGFDAIVVGIERQLRSSGFGSGTPADVVGWLTTYFPQKFEWDQAETVSRKYDAVVEQLENVPGDGVGYGALRYLSGGNSQLSGSPILVFNYLGNELKFESKAFDSVEILIKGLRDPAGERHHLFELNAYLSNGSLKSIFSFPRNLFNDEFIAQLLEIYDRVISELLAEDSVKTSLADDFEDSGLSNSDLDKLMGQLK